jgi:hypothetical protein
VARGIKVDTIRGRLADVGRIDSVAPRVTAGGGIAFDFQVAAADQRAFLSWRDDGVTYDFGGVFHRRGWTLRRRCRCARRTLLPH